jgi:DNA sulfur modification protein DndC
MQVVQMPVEVMERAALDAITELLRQGRTLVIAYSGGKDSTTVLLLALNAARAFREAGHTVPPILITHGNTGVENPVVVGLVHQELAKARAYGKQHGFDVRTEIATPSLNDTWAVSILSGRKLPTFSNNSRDCSVSFKIRPMERLRNQILGRKKKANKTQPVTLIGTRFEESDGRATRMNERGETAYTPWVKDRQSFMSPIADWDMGDVWMYLAKYRDGKKEGFTNAKDVFEIYASAADDKDNTCAVVGDMATEGHKKSRACGARLGCSVCTAVGRDRSLEAMLNRDENLWMRPLNMIQRFLVESQHDWSRRNWVGRSLNEGYIAVVPDTYSPAMLAELLRYCVTADADEARRARRLGKPPGFQLVSEEQMFAIDAAWSLNGIQKKPFAALKIWHEVHEEGKRFYPPELEPVAKTPKPKARYLKVGAAWNPGRPGVFDGFRDLMNEGFGDDDTRVLKDGRRVADFEEAPSLNFDPEAMQLFMDFEASDVLRDVHDAADSACTEAFFRYTRLGMLATSEGNVGTHVDRIMQRTNWRIRQGLVGDIDLQALLAKTVSRAEMVADVARSRGIDPEAALRADFAETALAEINKASKKSKSPTAGTPRESPRVPAEREPIAPQMALFDAASADSVSPLLYSREPGSARPQGGQQKAAPKVKSQAPIMSQQGSAPQMALWADPPGAEPSHGRLDWAGARDRFASLLDNVSLAKPEGVEDEESAAVEAHTHQPSEPTRLARFQ